MHSAPEVVSIIIPTYNRADIVVQAIESARAQDYPSKQIIVVDDGSTDSTPAAVTRFSDVEYVRQQNGGPASARNTGLKHARANYIATLDSDDCWDKGYLAYAINRLQRHNAQIFFANWREAEPDDSITCTDYFANVRRMQPYLATADQSGDIALNPEQCRKLFLGGLPAPSSGLVMSRNLVKGWENLHFSEDWLMPLKAVLTDKPGCVFTNNVLWTKRRDGKNIYDLAVTTPQHKHKLAVDTDNVFSHVKEFLTLEETREFRNTVAERYFDYAYSISSTDTMRALSFYKRSNEVLLRAKTCAAMLKTLVKAVAGKSAK
ncbi:MAG: glycosyl transferase family 2 [Verrucomicrobiales bacterium]|nr:glycosyl transferase family 2 [Verrucomicrobiales bacterium]